MSWTDKELDNLFKEAAGKQQVPYNDAYWAEMEAMLGAKKKRKGAFWWWFSGAVVLLAGIGTVGYFAWNGDNTTAQIQTASHMQSSTQGKMNDIATSQESKSENNQTEQDLVTKAPNKNLPIVTTDTSVKKNLISENDKPLNTLKEEQINSASNEAMNAPVEVVRERLAMDQLTLKPKGNVTTNYFNDKFYPLPFLATKKMGFYVEANGGVAQSYSSIGKNIGWTTGVNAGVEKYSGNWIASVGLGVRYESYSNIQTAFERKYYSFGAVFTEGNQQYNNFARIEMPIQLTYEVGRWHVTGGFIPNYLVGVQTSASETMKDSYPGYNESTQFGYNGKWVRTIKFKPFGVKSHVGLGYTLASKWTINVSYQTQLTRVTNPEAFPSDVNRFPGMIQIGLRKRF